MAMINCPECDNEVSDKAISCPKCGFGLASIEFAKIIEQNKKSQCVKDIGSKFELFYLARKKAQIEETSIEYLINWLKSMIYMIMLILPLFIYFFLQSKWEKRYKKVSGEINDCLKKRYMTVSADEANTYFNFLESNVNFSDKYSQDTLLTKIYMHAFEIDADAILYGNMNSSTETIIVGRDNEISSGSITTHTNTVSFLKLRMTQELELAEQVVYCSADNLKVTNKEVMVRGEIYPISDINSVKTKNFFTFTEVFFAIVGILLIVGGLSAALVSSSYSNESQIALLVGPLFIIRFLNLIFNIKTTGEIILDLKSRGLKTIIEEKDHKIVFSIIACINKAINKKNN